MRLFKISMKKLFIAITNVLISIVFLFSARRCILRLTGAIVGDKVTVHSQVRFYALGNLEIGAGSTLNKHVLIDNRGLVKIGKNVNISHSCQIYTQTHDINKNGAPLMTKNVVIGDHAWLFPNVTIMPGVKIGHGAVLYPSAVVTKNVDNFSVVAGNPARHLKYRNRKASWELNNRIHFSI